MIPLEGHWFFGFWRTDSRFEAGGTLIFEQLGLIRHVDELRVASSACWFLAVSKVSAITPEELSNLSTRFM